MGRDNITKYALFKIKIPNKRSKRGSKVPAGSSGRMGRDGQGMGQGWAGARHPSPGAGEPSPGVPALVRERGPRQSGSRPRPVREYPLYSGSGASPGRGPSTAPPGVTDSVWGTLTWACQVEYSFPGRSWATPGLGKLPGRFLFAPWPLLRSLAVPGPRAHTCNGK